MKILYLLLLAVPTLALASPKKIFNPLISDSITVESPLGKCISTEMGRQGPTPFGKLIAFGMIIQKYQSPDSTQPMLGVAELSFMTEESASPLKRSVHVMELVTKDPTGWKSGIDSSGFNFMYAEEIESVSQIHDRKSEDLQFNLDLQPCEKFVTYSSSSN